MKSFLLIPVLLLASCASASAPAPSSAKDPAYTLQYSEGACAADEDCSWAGEGCGGGHGLCTDQPQKYAGAVTTCEVNPGFPANRGYACGCIAQEKKCGWEKIAP